MYSVHDTHKFGIPGVSKDRTLETVHSVYESETVHSRKEPATKQSFVRLDTGEPGGTLTGAYAVPAGLLVRRQGRGHRCAGGQSSDPSNQCLGVLGVRLEGHPQA